MNRPILAKSDERALERLVASLPHATIIVAEPGLDVERFIGEIVSSQPSQIFNVSPQENKSTIGVDQIRSFIASVRTYADQRRVCLISPANSMTEEAQNALLKVLEEPSDGLHIILSATSTEGILPTVLSRCQALTLSRTSPAQDDLLLDDSDLDGQSRQQIQFLATGRPELIRQLIADPELFSNYRQLATDAKAIISGTGYQALQVSIKYATTRQEALRLIDVVLSMIRFQAKRRGIDASTSRLLEAINRSETALRANGNIKLSLLQLIA